MKMNLLILLSVIMLAGCGMSIEEYQMRSNYCKSKEMRVLVTEMVDRHNGESRGIWRVKCVDKDGIVSDSKVE